MALPSIVLIAVALVCCVLYFARKIQRKPKHGEPQLVPGHFLWGNGTEFSKNAAQFIRESGDKYGGLFTIRLLHYHMTVLADPHSCESFSREKNFDFQTIQGQVCDRVFGYSFPGLCNVVTVMTKTTKGPAMSSGMRHFQRHLDSSLDLLRGAHHVSSSAAPAAGLEWVETGLVGFVSDTIFRTIFNSIFGPDKETASFNYRLFGSNLQTFHKYFNLIWLGLPKWLFPEAYRAMRYVLQTQPSSDTLLASPYTSDYVKAMVEHLRDSGLGEDAVTSHNLGYLHINMNTFKAALWCLYNIISDPAAVTALRAEINDKIADIAGERAPDTAFRMNDIESLKVLDSVVNESLRLASGALIVRHNRADTQFTVASTDNTYTIRAGDTVCMHPQAIHKDPEIFENPMAFKYDRFVDKKFYKNGVELKTTMLAFGTLCPGKHIAMLQIKWFLIVLLSRLDIELLPGQTTSVDIRFPGHEIMPPTNDVQVRYRFKEAAVRLSVSGY